ncbi:MAG: hypothetical protein ACT4NP_11360 [Pseudonocardiales bacterium]
MRDRLRARLPGRERYEQIERMCRQVLDHPTVQGAAGVVSGKISEVGGRNTQKDR